MSEANTGAPVLLQPDDSATAGRQELMNQRQNTLRQRIQALEDQLFELTMQLSTLPLVTVQDESGRLVRREADGEEAHILRQAIDEIRDRIVQQNQCF